MTLTSFIALTALAMAEPGSEIQRQMLTLEDGSGLRYAIAVPADYHAEQPVPLILALHFGWGEALPSNYGAIFLEILVEPALRELGAIIVAPNCPARSWVDPDSEAAVLALLDQVRSDYAIDEDRIVVTGFSLGGMGTWYFASRHADMLSAAIPMASRPIIAAVGESGSGSVQRFVDEGSVDWPADVVELPIYVIHSRQDELIAIDPVERAAAELRSLGGNVEFMAIEGIGHHETPRYVPYLRRVVPWLQALWR